ncbi:MAG: glycosyltransferase [Bacteroidetes bacterium]|nr:MAG: glycosyltransferase [Bacteroidota bacterium]
MKILQLCSKVTFPAKDGYSIAVNAISTGMTDIGNEVRIISFNTLQHHIKSKDITKEYDEKYKPVFVDMDTFVKPIPAFLNLFTNKSYNIVRFISKDFKQKLIDLLEEDEYDIVQFESLFTTPYLETVRKHTKAKAILRAHNVENTIWNRRYKTEKNPLRKWYLGVLTRRLRNYEENIINKFDGIAAISKVDKQYFIEMGCEVPLETIPIGINIELPENELPMPEPNSLFFIGTLDWMPNVDGLTWFLNDAWETINSKFPELKLYIAGRYSEKFKKKFSYPNVTVIGEVEDSYKFINSKEIMVVPLKYGSGTRVKIIEAMALGKVIITTSVGVEGIEAKHEENILIADTKSELLETLSKYLNSKDLLNNISENAKKFARENYNNPEIIKKLEGFYNSL